MPKDRTTCKKCDDTDIHTAGGSGKWYKCGVCGYIGEYKPHILSVKKPKETDIDDDLSGADMYLDWYHKQY